MTRPPDIFFAECVIAAAEDAPAARIAILAFLHSLNSRLTDTPEMILRDGLSPTGQAPATHFICTRHICQSECDALKVWPKMPITCYFSDQPIVPDGSLKAALAAHESKILATLGLRRVA